MGTGENTRQLVESTSRTSGRWPGEGRALGKTQVMAITETKSSSRRKRVLKCPLQAENRSSRAEGLREWEEEVRREEVLLT